MLRPFAYLAVCGPALLAANLSPSATFFNQAVALVGWAGLLGWASWFAGTPSARVRRTVAFGLAVPALVVLGIGWSHLAQGLPLSLALSAFGLVGAAALAVTTGALTSHDESGRVAYHSVCEALVLAGAISALIACVQIFAPYWADGTLIASASTQNRAGGNLRQPNHLSSLLLLATVALLWLHETDAERRPAKSRLPARLLTLALVGLLMFGDVLTVSRTGAVCVLILAVWGFLDGRLSRFTRLVLWVAPLLYALFWFGLSEGTRSSDFAGAVQLHKSDPSSSRFGIWANTFELIRQNPWAGVGWGEFNFAWSLTTFPQRPVAFFDHTHNLPLNLLVELGVPFGTLVLLILIWLMWKAFVACRVTTQAHATTARAAFVMVLMMVTHSMLEYPLWYAYFLLPTAFVFGVGLGHSVRVEAAGAGEFDSPWSRRVFFVASLALGLGTVAAVLDYLRVTQIFNADQEESTSLSHRVAEGQKSIFFAHHADYAAATVATHPSTAWKAFRRAPHLLLDTRLMMAWATAYAEKGDVERARYIADRLREFRNPDSAEFFAQCDKPRPPGTPEPFQCKPATRQFTYEDFKLR